MKLSSFDMSCMLRAIELSKESAKHEESPFGAVVADNKCEKVLSEGYNRTHSSKNPIRHAEIEALNSLFINHPQSYGDLQLTLYSSCEPCLMCLGAAHYAGIKRIVFGVSVKEILQFGSDDPNYSSDPIMHISGMNIEIIGGVLRNEAIEILEDFSKNHGSL